jgi:hypothetical protein
VQKSTSIIYFDNEGRENLPQVLRGVKRAMKKRPELRDLKLVILTATGEGPALAYAHLHEYDPRIIAVTFPPDFVVRRGEDDFHPQISVKLHAFFRGVGVKVLTSRLPFDQMEGAEAHNQQMQLIRDVLTLFGGSFALCIQAILSACDHGEVVPGERVIGMTGDTAAIITASTSQKFLSKAEGLVVNEIICKARNLTLSRKPKKETNVAPVKVLEESIALANKTITLKALPQPDPYNKK